MKTRVGLVFAVILCFAAALTVFPRLTPAQDQDQQDPPGRVARLGYMEGSVSFEPAGEQDWVQADVDRPLTTGDSLWVDQNSRGELHIGGTALRLGSQTGISFLNLNDQAVQIQLAQGSLTMHVRRLDQGDAYEVDAPNLAFTIGAPGDYRLDVDPNGNTTSVTVLSGQGAVSGGGQNWNVTPGQRAVFNGTDQLAYSVQGAANDSFESWSRSREMREEHLASARYVSPDVTGYEDLDQYGGWHNDSTYGAYWVPNQVDANWAPYHEGHWAWVAPWGWTWVDAQPWGFAPYHYGRWAMFGNNWGWVPGPVADTRCVYAPALVGFVGGGGFGVSVAFGGGEGVGWFPLGPRDVYVPPYQVSSRYVEQINVSNTRVIERTTVVNVYNNYTVNHVTNINYTYANNTRAVMAVNREAFVSGARVRTAAIRVNAAEIEHPRVVTTGALTPTRASVVGSAAVHARALPPRTIETRRVVTKMTPSPRAVPLGKPRPRENPNLSAAMVNRAGFSPQAQSNRAAAVAKVEASRPATETRPNETRPGETRPSETKPNTTRPTETRPNEARPNQPATRPNETRPNETRPTETRPNETRPNETRPNQPATRPNETRPNETRPTETKPNEARPSEPRPNETRPNTTRPNEPRPNETRPNTRPTEPKPDETRPNETRPSQPRPETRPATPSTEPRRPEPETKPKTVTPPQEKRATPPPKEQPKPNEKEKEKPKPKPEPQPQPQQFL